MNDVATKAKTKPVTSVEKDSVENLAIFGGLPAFVEKLHVGRPNIGDRDRLMKRIGNVLDSRWLTNGGPCAQEFEHRIADLVGVKHCIAICNATVALEIAIRALGLRGEVIVPSFTFIATAHALQWQEITPVFCDVAPGTHNIEPCQVEALQQVADAHGLKLLFDAAHAFGCSHAGQMIGNFGEAEIFSFHAT